MVKYRRYGKMENQHVDEALRLLKWISAHREDWKTICDPHYEHVDVDKYLEIMLKLREQSFYQIMMIFINNTQELFPIYDYLEGLGIKKIIEDWDEGSGEKLLSFLMNDMLKENREREKKREEDSGIKNKRLCM